MIKKKKLPTIKHIKEKADRLFSDFIRDRDQYTCVTCGRQGDKNEIDAGHFVSRYIMNLRYDERNVHAQCRKCNRFQGGQLRIYSMRMIEKYGSDILYELEEKEKEYRKGKGKYGRDFFNSIISLYKPEN